MVLESPRSHSEACDKDAPTVADQPQSIAKELRRKAKHAAAAATARRLKHCSELPVARWALVPAGLFSSFFAHVAASRTSLRISPCRDATVKLGISRAAPNSWLSIPPLGVLPGRATPGSQVATRQAWNDSLVGHKFDMPSNDMAAEE